MKNSKKNTNNHAADALLLMAKNQLEKGDVVKAEATLKNILTEWPNDVGSNELLSMIFYKRGDMPAAAECLIRAATNDELNPELHANCGSILNLLGRYAEAEAALRHSINLDPILPEAHAGLGISLEGQKKVSEAREAYNEALALRPSYTQVIINLGNLELRSGRSIDAIEYYSEAISKEPVNAVARANLGTALRSIGAISEAHVQCQQATKDDPEYPEGWNALGQVERELCNYPAAIAAFLKAVKLRKGFIEAHANLAGTYFKAQELNLAKNTYNNLLQIAPEFAEGYNGLGVVHTVLGDKQNAISNFRKAVELRPSFGEAWTNVVSACEGKVSKSEINIIKEMLENKSVEGEDLIGFYFALGDIFEKKRCPDEAFNCFVNGNSLRQKVLKKKNSVFNPKQYAVDVGTIINTMDRNFIDSFKINKKARLFPLHILGMPRSGTTIVEQVLSMHTGVKVGGELGLMGYILGHFPKWLNDLNELRIKQIYDYYLDSLSTLAENNAIITEKTPFNFLYLGLIEIIFPQSLVIYCRRDSRDVAISCFKQDFKAPSPWATSINWISSYIEAEIKLMEHWKKTVDLPILEVEYEKLVQNPEEQIRRIIKFAGLPWQESCLNFHRSSQAVHTASSWQVRKPVYTDSVGKWREYKDLLPKTFIDNEQLS